MLSLTKLFKGEEVSATGYMHMTVLTNCWANCTDECVIWWIPSQDSRMLLGHAKLSILAIKKVPLGSAKM